MLVNKIDSLESKELQDLLKARSFDSYKKYTNVVDKIIDDVKNNGDVALFKYTEEFDGYKINTKNMLVSQKEIIDAYHDMETNNPKLLESLRLACDNIRKYHLTQVEESKSIFNNDGSILTTRVIPLSRVGIYVPGGKASYPSTVLMNAIPASVAGVEEIIMFSPVKEDGKLNQAVLVAAKLAGVHRIYKIGGAQAIAAAAYGTENIPRVDKITGPGNIYVALAKKAVYGDVNIDSIAGPSEIMVLADSSAKAEYVCADLLSQAEHDELASAVLVTTSEELANKVSRLIWDMAIERSRYEIIKKSLNAFGKIFLVDNKELMINIANLIAPEHLELQLENAFDYVGKIKNAGAVFVGSYASEPIGDYVAGPNHTLPTNGSARYMSVLNVSEFTKKSSVIYYTKEALSKVKSYVECLANYEGLDAHANAVKIRE